MVFGALVFKLTVCCGAEGYVSGLRAAAAAPKPDRDFMNFFTHFQVNNQIKIKTDDSEIIVTMNFYLAECDLAFNVEVHSSDPGAWF